MTPIKKLPHAASWAILDAITLLHAADKAVAVVAVRSSETQTLRDLIVIKDAIHGALEKLQNIPREQA